MRSKIATIAGIASPLVAMQVVNVILFALNKLNDLMLDTLPSDATIVQSAIDLTSAHSTWVAVALAAFGVYMWKMRSKASQLASAGWAAAMVAPASLYLLR